MQRSIKLPPFNNVVASGTANIPIVPQGVVYDAIILQLGGTTFTKAMINAIRVKVGGITLVDITGSDLDAINSYYKITANASFLAIHFSDPNGMDPATKYTGAIDTISQHFSGFQIEVDIGAATAPTLTAYAIVRDVPKPGEVADVVRYFGKSVQSFLAAMEYVVDFPKGNSSGAQIGAIHLFNANITEVKVYRDSLPLVSDGLDALLQYMQNERTRITQAGLISFDAMLSNDLSDLIPTLNGHRNGNAYGANFQLKVTFSAADTIRLYSELLAPIGSFQ